ncbi:AsmA family protein [Pigmentiphaga soli]|uniref:AsmA family protein n=1 Tax=Pigmentiphaga soli TaxID=1007095 RepID=A0ABP8HQD5_9BURK
MRWFKRIAIGLAALVAVAVVCVGALALLVDPAQYKTQIAGAVSQRYGRTLRIDGGLKLAFFPRLGLEMGRASLSEPRSAQIFAAVDSARVAVAVWPLLSRRVVIDHLRVDGLKANVVRDARGRFNFDDLLEGGQARGAAPAGPAAGAPSGGGAPLQFDVAGIEFTNGELALRDQASGRALRLERLSASAGRIVARQPFAFDVSARVLGQAPRVDASVQGSGRIEFDPALRRFAARDVEFKASGVLPSVRANAFAARGSVEFDGQKRALDASGVSVTFQGDVAGDTPLTGIDARADVPAFGIGIDEGRIRVDKLSLSAQGRAGADPFELNLAAPRLQVTDRSAEGDDLTGRLRLSGEAAADARFTLSGVSGSADKLAAARLDVSATLRRGARTVMLTGASPLEASVRQRTLSLSRIDAQLRIDDPGLPGGNMAIPASGSVRADFAKEALALRLGATIDGGRLAANADLAQFDTPRVNFSLNAEKLDLDRLFPPRPPAGGADGAAGGGPAPDAAIDLSPLQGFTAHGTVRIGQLVARGVHADDAAATVRVANGRADVSGLKASLYGGSLSGSLFADANTHRLGLAPSLSNVLLQPLLADAAGKDVLSGRGNVALNLTATGQTAQALRASLNGTGQLSLRDGAIKGIDLARSLREFKSMLALGKDAAADADGARQTDFSEMQAQLVFANGVGTVRSLNVKAPLLRIAGGDPARIDVAASRLDLVANVTVVNTSTGQDGKELAQLHGATIPVRLSGPFDAPRYEVLWSRVGASLLENAIRKGIGKQPGTPGKPADKPLDAVRDRLKKLFER